MPKLTKSIVEGLAAASREVFAWDTELPGFGVRVLPSGRKTYCMRYRNELGIQRKLTLARCVDMTPDRARELARKRFAEVAEGADPAAARRQPKTAATVENLFKGYVAGMRAKGQASADEVERALLTSAEHAAADALGRDRPAGEVTPELVIRFVSAFFKRGKRAAADKARSYVASAFAWGIASANDYTVEHRQDWGLASNPAAVLAKDTSATKSRERNLVAAHVRALWGATLTGAGFSFEVAACIRTLIACGQRVQETLRLEGRDLDLERGVWTMPAEKTKLKKAPHCIPLPAVILPTLRELVAKHGDGPLFPSPEGSADPVIDSDSINQAIGRWLKAQDGIEHFQTRDLRRTWKSRTADAGIDRFTRDLIQQHAKGDTGSKHYDMADYLPQMRQAMTAWSAWLGVVLAGGVPPAAGQPMLKAA